MTPHCWTPGPITPRGSWPTATMSSLSWFIGFVVSREVDEPSSYGFFRRTYIRS